MLLLMMHLSSSYSADILTVCTSLYVLNRPRSEQKKLVSPTWSGGPNSEVSRAGCVHLHCDTAGRVQTVTDGYNVT